MYYAILFHPDGEYVTDFRDRETKEDVWEELAEMGSRWIFYPITFVAKNKTIVDTPEGLEYLNRKRINTVSQFFSREWEERADEICNDLNEGVPLQLIY